MRNDFSSSFHIFQEWQTGDDFCCKYSKEVDLRSVRPRDVAHFTQKVSEHWLLLKLMSIGAMSFLQTKAFIPTAKARIPAKPAPAS